MFQNKPQLTKHQEFDLLFKYTEFGFNQTNLYDTQRWDTVVPSNLRNFDEKTFKSFVTEYKEFLNWSRFTYFGNFNKFTDDLEFFEEIQDYLDWTSLYLYASKIQNPNLTIEFVKKFRHKIYWSTFNILSDAPDEFVSEEFLKEFKNDLYWKNINYENFSEELIEKFKTKVSWSGVSAVGTLSEDFIRRYQKKISWRTLSKNRKTNFSLEFMQEFDDKIYWKDYVKNRKTLFK